METLPPPPLTWQEGPLPKKKGQKLLGPWPAFSAFLRYLFWGNFAGPSHSDCVYRVHVCAWCFFVFHAGDQKQRSDRCVDFGFYKPDTFRISEKNPARRGCSQSGVNMISSPSLTQRELTTQSRRFQRGDALTNSL